MKYSFAMGGKSSVLFRLPRGSALGGELLSPAPVFGGANSRRYRGQVIARSSVERSSPFKVNNS